jgi:hypothetical protein
MHLAARSSTPRTLHIFCGSFSPLFFPTFAALTPFWSYLLPIFCSLHGARVQLHRERRAQRRERAGEIYSFRI